MARYVTVCSYAVNSNKVIGHGLNSNRRVAFLYSFVVYYPQQMIQKIWFFESSAEGIIVSEGNGVKSTIKYGTFIRPDKRVQSGT